ncbi:LuxR C-terminal-related transcriptional regulator [Pandoraea sp. NPDC087047]|uniref:LuxR C-terminal-related transcriptional regulator n=1 Tax=Pandoraea sp. NPDC087047 TaxID=3364390 RepID=UPI003824C94A
MKSESSIISFVQNFPVSASLKTADTGQYVVNNAHNSRQFGIENPRDIKGLTIKDIRFRATEWGKLYAKSIAEHDFLVHENQTSVTLRNRFLDDSGDAQMEEMTKLPIMGTRGNVLGITTFRRDITSTLPPISVYQLNRNFYRATDAIERTMIFFGIKEYFILAPSETQFRVFLLKAERLTNKEISRALRISDRTVECHCVAIRNKVAEGSFATALSATNRRTEYSAN